MTMPSLQIARVVEQIPAPSSTPKVVPPACTPVPSNAEASSPCTVASIKNDSSRPLLSVGGSRSPGVTTRLPSTSPEVLVDVVDADRPTGDLFLQKLRTKIAGDQAFRQRLRMAIALHENNDGHRQQQYTCSHQQDVLRTALSVSRDTPPPSFTRSAAERSLLLRRKIQQEIHLSSILEAELSKRCKQRWQEEQHLRLAALIYEEERELEVERLRIDLAVQTARLQAQAASVRLAAAHEAELLAAEASLTPKSDMFCMQRREAAAPAASPQHSSDGNYDRLFHSLVQSMTASEASCVQLQFLYGAYGSLPSSYRAVINRSQSSRQDFLVLIGEKGKKDNCIVEMKPDISGEERQERFRRHPTKRSRMPSSHCSTKKKKRKISGSVSTSKKNKERTTKTKKVKRWTWKKDPGAPSRPLSAYNIFFSEERRRIIEEIKRKKNSGEDDDGEHSIGNSDERPPSSGSKYPGEFAFDMLMERRINPNSTYKQRKAKDATKAQSTAEYKNLTKTIATRWKSLPSEELAEYKRLAELDTKRYKEDMDKYSKRQEEVAAAETLKDMILFGAAPP